MARPEVEPDGDPAAVLAAAEGADDGGPVEGGAEPGLDGEPAPVGEPAAEGEPAPDGEPAAEGEPAPVEHATIRTATATAARTPPARRTITPPTLGTLAVIGPL